MNSRQLTLKYSLICLLVITCPQLILAQLYIVEGKVLNAKNNKPIAYANIGIEGRNVGTVSKIDGSFKLEIPREFLTSFLKFSSVVHEGIRFKIEDLINKSNLVIQLEEKVLELKNVDILAKRRRQRTSTLGIKRIPYIGNGVMGPKVFSQGAQLAHLIEPDNFPVIISKARIHLGMNYNKSLLLRVRVMEKDSISGKLGKDLLLEDVIVDISLKTGWLDIDLENYKLILDKAFFICFEFLNPQPASSEKFMVSFITNYSKFQDKQFIRLKSFDQWEFYPSYMPATESPYIFAIGAVVLN